jgi:hypothetical protein
VLGLQTIAGDTSGQSLIDYLLDKKVLLVLNRFERLAVEGADLVISDLLSRCSGVKLLVTSGAELQIPGEHPITVLPLGLSELARSDTLIGGF